MGLEDLRQGKTVSAAIALRANLVLGGRVLPFVCQLVDLLGQFMHCAGP